jgi:hypothetical protein
MLERFRITDSRIFFGIAGLFVVYLLYMMIRKRRGERPGFAERESDL